MPPITPPLMMTRRAPAPSHVWVSQCVSRFGGLAGADAPQRLNITLGSILGSTYRPGSRCLVAVALLASQFSGRALAFRLPRPEGVLEQTGRNMSMRVLYRARGENSALHSPRNQSAVFTFAHWIDPSHPSSWQIALAAAKFARLCMGTFLYNTPLR